MTIQPLPVLSETARPFRVDPFAITDLDRTDDQLVVFFVFCCCVAGKKATTISSMVENFFANCGYPGDGRARLRAMAESNSMGEHLRRARLGKYSVLVPCMRRLAGPDAPDLRTAGPTELETLPGVGPKTSRFLILHSRRGARVAVIDTHMLKYLRDAGVAGVPTTVPTGLKYLRLEAAVLAEADRLGLNVADFDLQVWSWYARGNKGVPRFEKTTDKATLVAVGLPTLPPHEEKAA